MADTKPTDPASSHQNASADEADARFLRWAEERLVGTHELCCLCRGDGWDPYTERTCAECQGAGQCIRHEYIMAENALSPEQRREIGEEELRLANPEIGKLGDLL